MDDDNIFKTIKVIIHCPGWNNVMLMLTKLRLLLHSQKYCAPHENQTH